mgnify:CR=1 FL=1
MTMFLNNKLPYNRALDEDLQYPWPTWHLSRCYMLRSLRKFFHTDLYCTRNINLVESPHWAWDMHVVLSWTILHTTDENARLHWIIQNSPLRTTVRLKSILLDYWKGLSTRSLAQSIHSMENRTGLIIPDAVPLALIPFTGISYIY